MDVSRRRFLIVGVMFATAVVTQPVLACPDIEKLVDVAKTFVGSTDYKDDSLQLCFDIYRKAKIRLRAPYDTSLSRHRITTLVTSKIRNLKTQHGALMLWQRQPEVYSAPLYAALYLGGDEVLTSWNYSQGFSPAEQVTIVSHKQITQIPYLLGYVPVFTIAAGD